MSIEPEMNDPDWDRYLIAKGKIAPVGMPIRWGGIAVTPSINTSAADPTNAIGLVVINTQPIVNAAALDEYARQWSIVGSLKAPIGVFYNSFPTTPKPGGYPIAIPPVPGNISVLIEVTLGIGQFTFVQTILLAAGGEPTKGLCNTQSAVNGGPYGELNDGVSVTRPFAAVSSIAASTISVRGVYEQVAPSAWARGASITVGISPFAAGTLL